MNKTALITPILLSAILSPVALSIPLPGDGSSSWNVPPSPPSPPSPPEYIIKSAGIHLDGVSGRYYKNGVMQVPVAIKYELLEGYSLSENGIKLYNSNSLKPIEEYSWHYTTKNNGFRHDVPGATRSTTDLLKSNDTNVELIYITPDANAQISSMDICFRIEVESNEGLNSDSFDSCKGDVNNNHVVIQAVNGTSIDKQDFSLYRNPSNTTYNKNSIQFTTTDIRYIGDGTNEVTVITTPGQQKQAQYGNRVIPSKQGVLLERHKSLSEAGYSDYTPLNHRSAISYYMPSTEKVYSIYEYYAYNSEEERGYPHEYGININNSLGVIATMTTTSNREFRMSSRYSFVYYCLPNSYRPELYRCKYGASPTFEKPAHDLVPRQNKTGIVTVQDAYGTMLDIPFQLVDKHGDSTVFGKNHDPLWVDII